MDKTVNIRELLQQFAAQIGLFPLASSPLRTLPVEATLALIP